MTKTPAPTPIREVDPIARAWGDEIKARRKASGVTQIGLADSLGVHQTTVSQIERGLLAPSPRLQRSIVRELGMDLHTVYRLVRGDAA